MFGYRRASTTRRAILRAAYAFAVWRLHLGRGRHLDLARRHAHLPEPDPPAASVGGRAPGLTLHPNFLAMTCILALPIMLWQLVSDDKRTRVIAGLFIVALLLGLYASGSRAGFAVGPGAALLSVLIMPRYRKYVPSVVLGVAGIAAMLFVLEPSLGKSLLQAFRLGGDTGSAQGSPTRRGRSSSRRASTTSNTRPSTASAYRWPRKPTTSTCRHSLPVV